MNRKDVAVVRELARKYREIAADERNDERRQRMSDINDLKNGLRPPVWINEIPWHEFASCPGMAMVCEDSFLREMEGHFRRKLFQWEHFQVDMVAEPFYPVGKCFSCTGFGIEMQENIVKTDEKNNIVSHQYIDVIPTEEDLEKITPPVVTVHEEETQKNFCLAQEVLGDILPTRLVGAGIYCAYWDQIPRFRGVETVLYDMMDRPKFIHAIVKKFSDWHRQYQDQLEEYGLLEPYLSDLHCTPGYTSELPQKDYDEKARLKDVWFRGMAQMLNTVSPQMFVEFELDYMRPLMERCGLVYYGCCEPLDTRIPYLIQIPNMRKLGVSPWSDVECCAEQLGSRFVAARKPNPALVAISTDEDEVARETEQTIKACRKNNCPYEFVLKDISTVSGKLDNLVRWSNAVQRTIDKYY